MRRDTDVSPNAAPADLKKELLVLGNSNQWHARRDQVAVLFSQEAGPTCLSEQDKLLVCSSNSTRTQRAGVFEILYWTREDRTFCDSAFFRDRVTSEDATSELCRARLLSRNQSCYKSCDRCTFQCTNAVARSISTAWKCSAGLPTQGIFAAARISDVGVDIHHRHGANRVSGKPSIPEVAWPETHETLVGNDVDHPKVPRDCTAQ